MNIIVKDSGFVAEDWDGEYTPLAEASAETTARDVPSDADPLQLTDHIAAAGMIRIDFPSFADGRGFTIARRLRLMGYQARLRAFGHVLADQYAMARRSGFDEVEISQDLAARQPEEQWLSRADWQANSYQTRLRG